MSLAPDPAFEVISSEHRYRGWVIDIHTDVIRMPDGSTARRDVVNHPGAVAILALDAEDHVVTVRQYRAPVREHMLELPAGLLDVAGEPALTAAQRELAEETSLAAVDWAVLVDIHTSPGMTDEAIRIYLARGLSTVENEAGFQAHGEEVTMTVGRVDLDHLVQMVLAGEVTNSPAVAGALAAHHARGRGWRTLRPADAPWPARPALAG